MSTHNTLTAPLNQRPAPGRRGTRGALLARYLHADEPPAVDELSGDEASLIEDLYSRTAAACRLPALALREIIENLVHADFEGASVSVLDGGGRVRIADCGPGIRDKGRALEPGFSTACSRARAFVRGVGSGLPVALQVMEASGGTLDLADNLSGGTVVTLSASASGAPGGPATQEISEEARGILALLVELAPAAPSTLAKELGLPLGACGRELVLLEHRGLVARADDGARALTPAGADLLATLF